MNNNGMRRLDCIQIDQLLSLPKDVPLSNFEDVIDGLMKRKPDKEVALQELDVALAILQNHIQLLSLYLKQNYLIAKSRSIRNETVQYYTKQELANKYRVSVRTVTNWIIDGLEVEEVGGIKRISFLSLENFKNSAKGRKFGWKSISKQLK